jgi:hypothetical protein
MKYTGNGTEPFVVHGIADVIGFPDPQFSGNDAQFAFTLTQPQSITETDDGTMTENTATMIGAGTGLCCALILLLLLLRCGFFKRKKPVRCVLDPLG